MIYKGFSICYCDITRQMYVKIDWLTDYWVKDLEDAKRVIDRLIANTMRNAA